MPCSDTWAFIGKRAPPHTRSKPTQRVQHFAALSTLAGPSSSRHEGLQPRPGLQNQVFRGAHVRHDQRAPPHHSIPARRLAPSPVCEGDSGCQTPVRETEERIGKAMEAWQVKTVP
eukprot:2252700-Alexandrium_andersonii.AAC.1